MSRTQRKHPIGTAVVPNGDGTYDLVDSYGRSLLSAESWQVCANVQDSLLYDWQARTAAGMTECDEVADGIERRIA